MKVLERKADYVTLSRKQSEFDKVKITESIDAARFIQGFYLDDKSIFESFFICLLDRSNTVHGYAKISQGGTSGTFVDIKIIAKYAIDTVSSGVILAHNHPSGNMQPSNEDTRLTTKIKQGLTLLGVSVLDHIILSGKNDGYYSFADHGLL